MVVPSIVFMGRGNISDGSESREQALGFPFVGGVFVWGEAGEGGSK